SLNESRMLSSSLMRASPVSPPLILRLFPSEEAVREAATSYSVLGRLSSSTFEFLSSHLRRASSNSVPYVSAYWGDTISWHTSSRNSSNSRENSMCHGRQ